MLDRLVPNSTELTGLLSFAASTIACLIAGRRFGLPSARTWKVLAFMNCLFLIEIFFGFRFRIAEFARAVLKTDRLYTQLHGRNQETLIITIITVALVVAILLLFWRGIGGGAARIAASLTLAVLVLFAVETVSLHPIDAVYYQPIGPILAIGWAWAAAASGICLAAIPRPHA
jgi:hypothetical protein